MGVSAVLFRLFVNSNDVSNTAYAYLRMHEQNSIFKAATMGPMIPKKMKIISALYKHGETFYDRHMALTPANQRFPVTNIYKRMCLVTLRSTLKVTIPI